MKRSIVGYHRDERDDWVAELDCHHNQHVRHKPPFTNRPWVETEGGRTEKLGLVLDCARCDRFEFPEGLVSYKKTAVFNECSIPGGLLRDHATKRGTWGLIRVLEGELNYTVGLNTEKLRENENGIVVPNMLHSVAPIGSVRFLVEFYRKNG